MGDVNCEDVKILRIRVPQGRGGAGAGGAGRTMLRSAGREHILNVLRPQGGPQSSGSHEERPEVAERAGVNTVVKASAH